MKPGYQEGMQREVARGIIARPSGRGVILEIPCTAGHTVEHHLDKMLPPDAMPRQLAQRGWIIARRKATCPEHAQKEKPMPEPAAIAPEKEATPDAKRVHRAVMEALMSVYDDDGKRYSSGYTDARVAEETGAALAYVQKVREDYFGPIAEPAEVAAFREELATVRRQADKLESDAKAVATGIRATVDDLSAKLDRLVKANGWRS